MGIRTFWGENPPTNKIEKLRKACEKHTAITKEAAKAQGQDRHLYALMCLWQRSVDAGESDSMSATDGGSTNGYSSPVSDRDGVPSPNRASMASEEGSVQSSRSPTSQQQQQQHAVMPALFADAGWDKINNTILSTSNCGNPSLRHFGFGPTSGEGFGIGYIIKDGSISICASSKHRQTKRFVDSLESYLLEIRRVLRLTQRRGTSPKASRVREAGATRPKPASRLKSRGRVIKAHEPGKKTPGTMTPADESAAVSDDEGLGGYGFFDAGMLLQALKARGEGMDDGSTKPSERATVNARRREIGKKLRLSEY